MNIPLKFEPIEFDFQSQSLPIVATLIIQSFQNYFYIHSMEHVFFLKNLSRLGRDVKCNQSKASVLACFGFF